MMFRKKKIIYLDNAASTPIDRDVLKGIIKNLNREFANPSSIHSYGVNAGNILLDCKNKISSIINAHIDEIIFTGSGTESNALAILGTVYNFHSLNNNLMPHIVTTSIEHPAVLENCKFLEDKGLAEITYVDPDKDGLVNPKDIRSALKENTVLVSVMYANNEIGTIEPIQEIAKEIRHFRKQKLEKITREENQDKQNGFLGTSKINFPLFHTDACQAVNYLFISNIEKLGVDMMSFNSSKIYGPKGVGILYKKRAVNISNIYGGGGQEFGLRSGTENLANIVGVTLALDITEKIKEKESRRLIEIRNYTIDRILSLEKIGFKIILNGDKEKRLPNNINISILGLSSELIVIELDARGICVSEKSACQSEEDGGSYVVRAIRTSEGSETDPNENSGSVRISLGRFTTKKDLEYLILSLEKILLKYKNFKNI